MQHAKVIAGKRPGPAVSTHVRVLLDALQFNSLLPPVRNTFAGERKRVLPMRIADGARNR
jgi:hypothetical protein